MQYAKAWERPTVPLLTKNPHLNLGEEKNETRQIYTLLS